MSDSSGSRIGGHHRVRGERAQDTIPRACSPRTKRKLERSNTAYNLPKRETKTFDKKTIRLEANPPLVLMSMGDQGLGAFEGKVPRGSAQADAVSSRPMARALVVLAAPLAILLAAGCGKASPSPAPAQSPSPVSKANEAPASPAPPGADPASLAPAPQISPEQVSESERQPTSIRLSEFAAGPHPSLSGPFAGLRWGMSSAEVRATAPDVADATTPGQRIGEGCQFNHPAGWCTQTLPSGLSSVTAVAMDRDPEVMNHLTTHWGPADRSCSYSQMSGRQAHTWLSPQSGTVAQLRVDDAGKDTSLTLMPYISVADFIGPPDRPLGFVGDTPLIGLTVTEFQERFDDGRVEPSEHGSWYFVEHTRSLWFGRAQTTVTFDDSGRVIEHKTSFPMQSCNEQGNDELVAALERKLGRPADHPDEWRHLSVYPGGEVAVKRSAGELEIQVGNLP